MNMSNDTDHSVALQALGWKTLKVERKKAKAKIMYKLLNNMGPQSLTNLFTYNAHINGLPGEYTPGTTGGNEGEFGILSVYSACEPQGNYKLCNNRTTRGGEVGDFDVTI
jgi:hypothetical protein